LESFPPAHNRAKHGAQIEAHDVGRRHLRLEFAVELELFLDEL
jgi:hypothetical protein